MAVCMRAAMRDARFLSCCMYHRLPSHCSRAQGAPGRVGRVCISLLPSQVFSKTRLHHQKCSSHSSFFMISSTGCCCGCWVGKEPWGHPGALPIPQPEPSPAPAPLQTWGISLSRWCLGCVPPRVLLCTRILLRRKNYKDSRALKI